MSTWEQANRAAAALAAEAHADLGLDLDQPIDVFDVIQRVGIVLAFAPLDAASGLYIPSSGPDVPPGVMIHDGHPRSRQRFTAGHELGHHFFGHGVEVDSDLDGRFDRSDLDTLPDAEKEAESFAAWFLMPRRLMLAGMRELGIVGGRPGSPSEAYALSLWLGTSYLATVRQLNVTRRIDDYTARTWMRITPKSIKERMVAGQSLDDTRNDVWWLDQTSHLHPIDLRPGDCIILRLRENATTGFSWQLAELPPDVDVVADSFDDDWEPGGNVEELEYQADDSEIAGDGATRSLLLSVAPNTPQGVSRLALVLDRPWEQAPPKDEYEILVSVNPARHGVQLTEDELRIR